MVLNCLIGYGIGMVGIIPVTSGTTSENVSKTVKVSAEAWPATWRYTKHGWQDIGSTHRDSFVPLKSFELVHPTLFAASVLLAVVGTSIWASSEQEISRLLNHEADRDAVDQSA